MRVIELLIPMSLPPSNVLQWFCRHAGFPARRLDAPAELLVLFAAAAEEEAAESAAAGGGPIQRKDSARDASQRQLAENRRHAHFKSDNRTKV